jgi:hypothetical protein
MEKNIQIFFIINLFVIGLSHLLQAQIWVDFFKWLRTHGRVGIFAYSFLSLTFGSLIVAFHWHWTGFVPSMITFLGVAQVIKSMIGFLYPAHSLKTMHSAAAENPNSYKSGGIVFLAMSMATLFHILKH